MKSWRLGWSLFVLHSFVLQASVRLIRKPTFLSNEVFFLFITPGRLQINLSVMFCMCVNFTIDCHATLVWSSRNAILWFQRFLFTPNMFIFCKISFIVVLLIFIQVVGCLWCLTCIYLKSRLIKMDVARGRIEKFNGTSFQDY